MAKESETLTGGKSMNFFDTGNAPTNLNEALSNLFPTLQNLHVSDLGFATMFASQSLR